MIQRWGCLGPWTRGLYLVARFSGPCKLRMHGGTPAFLSRPCSYIGERASIFGHFMLSTTDYKGDSSKVSSSSKVTVCFQPVFGNKILYKLSFLYNLKVSPVIDIVSVGDSQIMVQETAPCELCKLASH